MDTWPKGRCQAPGGERQVIREGQSPLQGLLHFLSLRGSSPIRKENSLTTAPHPLVHSHQRLFCRWWAEPERETRTPGRTRDTGALGPWPGYRIHLLGKVGQFHSEPRTQCASLAGFWASRKWAAGALPTDKVLPVQESTCDYRCIQCGHFVAASLSSGPFTWGILASSGNPKIRYFHGALSQSLHFLISHLNWSEGTVLIWAIFTHSFTHSYLFCWLLKCQSCFRKMWNAGIYKEGIENRLWSHYSLLLTWSFSPLWMWGYFLMYTFHTVLYTTFSLDFLKIKPQS